MARTPNIKSSDVFKNLDYLTISKNHKKYYTFSGEELEGMTKIELQKKIGDMFGDEKFHVSMKTKGDFNNKTFFLPGLVMGKKEETKKESESSNFNFNFLLERLESNHKDQLQRLEKIYEEKLILITKRIDEKEKYISDLEKEIDKINSSDSGDMNKTLGLVMAMKNIFAGNNPAQALADNNNHSNHNYSSIPKEFLDLFANLDYNKINPNDLKNYYNILKQFTDNLPKIGV